MTLHMCSLLELTAKYLTIILMYRSPKTFIEHLTTDSCTGSLRYPVLYIVIFLGDYNLPSLRSMFDDWYGFWLNDSSC